MGVRDDVMTGNHYKVQKDYCYVLQWAPCALPSSMDAILAATEGREMPGFFEGIKSARFVVES